LRVTQVDIAEAIAKISQERRITQVVLGKTQKSRWKILLKGSFVERLMRSLHAVDIHIIATDS
jgi:two-component system sensor histidine kinase KdpD